MTFWLVSYWVDSQEGMGRGSWINYKMYPEKGAAEKAREELKRLRAGAVVSVEEWTQDIDGVLAPRGV